MTATLADGRVLYAGLALRLPTGPSALVGDNGGGKSTLLRQLAGDRSPEGGEVRCASRLAWLPQVPATLPPRAIDLLGDGPRLDALRRVLAGDGSAEDLVRVGEDWALEATWRGRLDALGLSGIGLDDDPARLSGGERQQLRLLAIAHSAAPVLLLDEPSTFLDAEASAHWCEAFARRAGAVLVATHDPAWLQAMPRLFELRGGALHRIDGGLATWRALRAERLRQGEAALLQARVDRTRAQQAVAHARQRLDRRQARGRRAGRDANQSPLLLDRLADNAERGQGRRRAALAQRLETGEQAVRVAFDALDAPAAPQFVQAAVALPPGRRVLTFAQAHPTCTTPAAALDWQAAGAVRIGLSGRNGSGKTTLLRAILGQGALAAGTVRAHVRAQRLDPHLDGLPGEACALDWLQAAMPGEPRAAIATRLALLGLGRGHVAWPMRTLSGGERMRVAIAVAAWARPAAPLLLLDEPATHLDLASVDALAALLRAWPGALLVVSHDAGLLEAIGLDVRLRLDADGLRLRHA
ncbi:hypothetical protein WQ56_09040 [Luteimonas sp. FCS-9]|nr:hypothetical protein WQ56_09040 [Luteimonas sp. FCS-9]